MPKHDSISILAFNLKVTLARFQNHTAKPASFLSQEPVSVSPRRRLCATRSLQHAPHIFH